MDDNVVQEEELMDPFLREMIEMANANEPLMDGTMGPDIINSADVVFAFWRDPSATDGVGMMTLKGSNLLRESAATGAHLSETSWSCLWCNEQEQAEALRIRIGSDSLN